MLHNYYLSVCDNIADMIREYKITYGTKLDDVIILMDKKMFNKMFMINLVLMIEYYGILTVLYNAKEFIKLMLSNNKQIKYLDDNEPLLVYPCDELNKNEISIRRIVKIENKDKDFQRR